MAYIELGDICDISKGEIGITKAIPGEYPMVTTGAERKSHNEFQLDTEAVLVPLVSATGHGHASIKRIHFQEGKFAFGSILAACVPKDNRYSAKFLYIYFQLMKDYILVPLMKGSANVSLTLGNLKTAKVPDISREMQESIVKLYSTLKIEQDEAIGILSNQKSDIDSLRQAILQDAVLGKLTVKWREENPSVEPASELLKRIEAEKQQLIAEKKIKKEKPLSPIEEGLIPFDLPENWEWFRWVDLLGLVKYPMKRGPFGSALRKDFFVKEGIKVFEQYNAINNDPDWCRYRITEEKYEELKAFTVEPGDMLISCSGTLGKICIIPEGTETGIINQALLKIRLENRLIDNKFFITLFRSNYLQSLVYKSAMGSAITNMVGVKELKQFLMPIPPLKEQEAIVDEVNTLMTLCDELEQQIENSQTQIEQLMQSCLKEVFEQESN